MGTSCLIHLLFVIIVEVDTLIVYQILHDVVLLLLLLSFVSLLALALRPIPMLELILVDLLIIILSIVFIDAWTLTERFIF